MHDTRTPCVFLTPALEPQRKKHACVFTLSISGAFVELLGILWFCSAQWRHLARNGSPDSSQLGGNMMNNAHLKPRIEPISELLLLVKPAASSCPPLDHEFPFVGSRVSALGSTFTVEGSQTCQRNAKRYVMLFYVMLCQFFRPKHRKVRMFVANRHEQHQPPLPEKRFNIGCWVLT